MQYHDLPYRLPPDTLLLHQRRAEWWKHFTHFVHCLCLSWCWFFLEFSSKRCQKRPKWTRLMLVLKFIRIESQRQLHFQLGALLKLLFFSPFSMYLQDRQFNFSLAHHFKFELLFPTVLTFNRIDFGIFANTRKYKQSQEQKMRILTSWWMQRDEEKTTHWRGSKRKIIRFCSFDPIKTDA